jgi:hypothetical protein
VIALSLVGEEDSSAEQVGAGASVHLSFEHLEAVDVAFDGIGAPLEAESVGDGVLVGAQAGGKGFQGELAGLEGGVIHGSRSGRGARS